MLRERFDTVRVILACMLGAGTGSSSCSAPREAPQIWSRTSAERAACDSAVLDVTLRALCSRLLLENVENRSGAQNFILDPMSLDGRISTAAGVRRELDAERWNDVACLVESLEARNKSSRKIDELVNPDGVITIKELQIPMGFPDPWGAFYRDYPDVLYCLKLSMPGYSADQGSAIVRFIIWPTAHGASGTCFLEKGSSSWAVSWTEIIYWM
jgi:hypothetical protein